MESDNFVMHRINSAESLKTYVQTTLADIFSVYYVNSLAYRGMPDPIRIRVGSARKHWPQAGRMFLAHWLASGPDPFGQNLTQSVRTKNRIPAGFAQYYPGRVWKNETESESGKLVAGRLRPARNRAQ